MAPLVAALLLALGPGTARAARANAADGAFSVAVPEGWTEKPPPKGYALQLATPDGKGGFSMQPAEAHADEAAAREALKKLADSVAARFKMKFEGTKKLSTAHPGQMWFTEGPLRGRTYLVGYHQLAGKWFRVDVLSDTPSSDANFVLSSVKLGGGDGKKRVRPDFVSPGTGWFTVKVPKGWLAGDTADPNEIVIETTSGDVMSVSYDPDVANDEAAQKGTAEMAEKFGGEWGVEFSPPRQYAIASRDFVFAAGHAEGMLVDNSLVGFYKAGSAYHRVKIRTDITRPLDMAEKVLETLRRKGEEDRQPGEGLEGDAKKEEPPAEPQKDPFAKMKADEPSGGGGGSILLMAGMALFLVLGVGLFAGLSRLLGPKPPPPAPPPPGGSPA